MLGPAQAGYYTVRDDFEQEYVYCTASGAPISNGAPPCAPRAACCLAELAHMHAAIKWRAYTLAPAMALACFRKVQPSQLHVLKVKHAHVHTQCPFFW